MKLINRFRFLFLYLFLIFFEIVKLGEQIKEKILISSSLDFSWFIDSIQRLNSGYLLGKDFIFTYGPLFQLLYGLPGLILKLPSHITFLINPLVSITIIYFMLLIFTRLIEKNKNEQFLLLCYLLFFVGLSSYASVDLIKMLTPLVFAISWQKYVIQKRTKTSIALAPLLPTAAGAFSYDLFIYCFIIGSILSFINSLKTKKINQLTPVLLIFIYHAIFSFALSGNMSYVIYSFDTILNYSQALNSFWTFNRSNFLFIFPAILIFCIYYFIKKTRNKNYKQLFIILSLVALFLLQSGVKRSDDGHIIRSIYPSIIVLFIILYNLAKKNRYFIVIILILFLFIPYKANFVFSLGGIKTVISTIASKSSFEKIYKFQNSYYLNSLDIKQLSDFILKNKEQVFIYPFDNYLLNINNTTYNLFPLQFFAYSNSIVEQKAIDNLKLKPPRYIIYLIDQKGTLDLDNIPNITRNSLLSKWIISNYSVKTENKKYLILQYHKNNNKNTINKSVCTFYEIEFISNVDHKISLLKKPIYYLDEIRLPKIGKGDRYIIFNGFNDSKKMTEIFNSSIDFNKFYFQTKKIEITKHSPFLKKRSSIILNNSNSKIYCYN